MAKKEKVILFFILLIAFFFRFLKLGQNPPSLSWDEAAIGYNAYSILKTGRDEHGRLWPFDYFTSFGDYKPPLAIYATVLPTAIYGLNEFSTRIPSALLGSLTVFVSYLLIKTLFPKLSTVYYLLFTFLFAISPWHILLSRAAFEANMATFFIVLGAYFFIRAIKERESCLLASAFSYLMSIYTFNTPRFFVPLLLLGLVIIYRDELMRIRRWVLLSILFSIIIVAPLVPHLLSPEGKLRFREVNIFTNLEVIKTANERIELEGNSLLARVLHNRRVGYVLLFAKHYLDHFNSGYLFFHGDVNPKFSIQDVGQLYLIEAPFLALGVYYLFKYGKREAWVVLLWLLTGLVPAGTARETPHALRTLITLPTWQIIIGFGIFGTYKSLKSEKFKKVFYYLLFTIYYLLFFYFLHNYFIHYPHEFSREWQDGYKETILYTKEIMEDYPKILVSDAYGRPYIYFLYYLRYPPLKYQQEAIRERNIFGQYKVKGFDRLRFGSIPELMTEDSGRKVLLIGRPEEIPAGAKLLKEIKFLNGETAFVVAESKI